MPALDIYTKFGKVINIDAKGAIEVAIIHFKLYFYLRIFIKKSKGLSSQI